MLFALCCLFLSAWPSAAKPAFDINWSDEAVSAGGAKGAVQLASGEILVTRTRWTSNAVQVICSRSTNHGAKWEDFSIIAEAEAGTDIGDGDLRQLANGNVLYSYRHNSVRRDNVRHFSIRVAVSVDAGKTWKPHSTVAESRHNSEQEPDALRGLWSSYLLQKQDGTLQCYYDDEETPHRAGFFRNQWLTLKTWDAESSQWNKPVTVSRAYDAKHLSRDGMPTVVELEPGKLLVVFESVQIEAPHANCVRSVTSNDGGKTWSWSQAERSIVFQPQKKHFMAISPWMTRAGSNTLICAFATDEDRDTPDKPATHPRHMNMDVKYVLSFDDGKTWSRSAQTIFDKTHRSYAPGVLLLQDGSLLATFMDFSGKSSLASRGEILVP
ncbi:MAG: exo-alpha-sialidase [Verrucomicrobia bacterium]|nr:exo-alpha-sialidase [Verrucomicrobiota bacterium]